MLSDMKTFTVRELDRQPGVVLDACDREGVVRIRRRTGQCYTIRPDARKPSKALGEARRRWLDDHFAWLERTLPKPQKIADAQLQELNRLIASDGRLL
jgi:hypothetical protein